MSYIESLRYEGEKTVPAVTPQKAIIFAHISTLFVLFSITPFVAYSSRAGQHTTPPTSIALLIKHLGPLGFIHHLPIPDVQIEILFGQAVVSLLKIFDGTK